jgi:hypothetical protein
MADTPSSFRDRQTTAKIVVATTVALFVHLVLWRAAAIVLSDLASSAFYAGGNSRAGDRQERPVVSFWA